MKKLFLLIALSFSLSPVFMAETSYAAKGGAMEAVKEKGTEVDNFVGWLFGIAVACATGVGAMFLIEETTRKKGIGLLVGATFATIIIFLFTETWGSQFKLSTSQKSMSGRFQQDE